MLNTLLAKQAGAYSDSSTGYDQSQLLTPHASYGGSNVTKMALPASKFKKSIFIKHLLTARFYGFSHLIPAMSL